MSRDKFENVLAELEARGYEVTAINWGWPRSGEDEIEYQTKAPKGNVNDEQKELFD